MPRVIPVDELEKLAFEAAKKEEKPQASRAKRIAKKVGLGAAALGAGAGVALLAMRPETRKKVFEAAKNPRKAWQGFKQRQGERARARYEEARSRYAGGAGAGAGAGGAGGKSYYRPSHDENAAFREYGLHDVKTKAEFKKKWNEHALKHHPDRPGGGDPEKMKHVNATFDAFKKSPDYEKLAMARYWAALAAALVR